MCIIDRNCRKYMRRTWANKNGAFKERILIYENLWFDEIIYQCHWNKESERCIMNPRAPKFREDLQKIYIYMPETMPRRDYRIVMTKLATPSPSKSAPIRQNITCTPLNWILHTFRAVHKGYHINRSNPHIQHVDNTRLSNVIMIFSSFLSIPLSGNTEAPRTALPTNGNNKNSWRKTILGNSMFSFICRWSNQALKRMKTNYESLVMS